MKEETGGEREAKKEQVSVISSEGLPSFVQSFVPTTG